MEYLELIFSSNEKIHCRFYDRNSKKLIVFFSGLRSRDSKTKVMYNRLSWVSELDQSCLFISDPALIKFEELRGGYYQGSKDLFAIEKISLLIRKIALMFNFLEEDIVLYGSSQGGFAALAVKAYLERAKVLAECPQTDLSILTSPNANEDRLSMVKAIYGVDGFDEIESSYRWRTSLFEIYEKKKVSPTFCNIIIKETDRRILEDHVEPFVNLYPSIKLKILTGDEGKGGHSAIDKKIIIHEIFNCFNN